MHSSSIKSNEIVLLPMCPVRLDIESFILKKVFHDQNHLSRFEYSSCISLFTPDWKINPNLHSLTLNIGNFCDLNSILVYMPNLKYLNINTTPLFPWEDENHAFDIDYIKLEFNDSIYGTTRSSPRRIYFTGLINFIKQFSTSLTCLSLNLLGAHTTSSSDLPFDGIQLEKQTVAILNATQTISSVCYPKSTGRQ